MPETLLILISLVKQCYLILQILATDRHMSHRMVTGSKDADPVPLIHGRFGYGVPKAKRQIVLDEVEDKLSNPKLSKSLNRSLRSTHTQDLLPTAQHHHTHEPTHAHPQEEE